MVFLSTETVSALTDKNRYALENEVVLEVNDLVEIPRMFSGKRRFVISME